MQRSLALFGVGRGPNVPVGGKVAKMQVTGLTSGELTAYLITDENPEGHSSFYSDGVYELPMCDYVSIGYTGSNKGLICFLTF